MMELSVFAEQNPNHVHYMEWPTCDLYDAIVWSPKSSHENHLIDLLDVLEKGPFNVKGRIKSIPDELKEFGTATPATCNNSSETKLKSGPLTNARHITALKPDLVNHEIQIAKVRRWSIERCNDEKIIIWALGNAAWYGIHPAPEYREIYTTMLQKAAIYNFIIDRYGHLSSKGARIKTPMSQLYEEMAENPVLGSPENCGKLVITHRRFIMAQLLEETMHTKYKRTPFWTFMSENYADEIEEVQTTIIKVQHELENQDKRKADRLTTNNPIPSPEPPSPGRRIVTRTRSGTASSGESGNGTSSKRKSRDHSTDGRGSRRRKTNPEPRKPTLGKTIPMVRLAQKSRRSDRVLTPSSPIPESSLDSQERILLSGRTTRSAISSQASPYSSSTPTPMDTDVEAPGMEKVIIDKPAPKPVEPPLPKPSVDTLKELIKEKTNTVPASKLSRVPGSKKLSKSNSPPTKKVTRASAATTVPSPPATLKASKKTQKKAPTPAAAVIPLDENHPGYDDLRDQAISKLTQLHSLYQKCAKAENQTQSDYEKLMELADENAEWRRQHGLKPVYIDVIYATGYYTGEIKDSSFVRRVPGTEYLVDTTDWDFETVVELLQNVNRGTYFQELLQPVKEAKRNARVKGANPPGTVKAGRGRPRKVVAAPTPPPPQITITQESDGIETSMSGLKISSVPAGMSLNAVAAAARMETRWKCLGHDDKGNHCAFELEDATTLEGAKKAADHWRTCELRKHATEEALEKKKANIEQAQTVLRDQQVRDPWTNIDHLVNWLEGEARKSSASKLATPPIIDISKTSETNHAEISTKHQVLRFHPPTSSTYAYTMAKAKLREILAADKGKVPYVEKQKKLQKEARRKKRKVAEEAVEEEEDDSEEEKVNGEEGWEDESSDEEDVRVIDTSKIDDSDSDSEDDDEDDDEDEEEEDEDEEMEEATSNGKPKAPKPIENADEEDDDEEDDEDIPLSEISEEDEDPEADIIPRQKLTIDNHSALLSSHASISLPIKKSTPFSLHQTLTTANPVEIKDVHDDLTRELAFYTQALDAAKQGRALLLSEGVPFTRPTDYFAEMVKSEEHMGLIKDRMKEEAARKQASSDAKRQRDLKKFGKQVQVARLQERHKEKRDMLDKINILKRKRAGADLGDENEDDPFEIAIEKASKPTGRDRRNGNSTGGPNAKRQKKNDKFGFGGRKKFAKSGDAMSSGDMSSFSSKGMKKNSFGSGKKVKAPRLGKTTMPLLEASEVAALGLSPDEFPIFNSSTSSPSKAAAATRDRRIPQAGGQGGRTAVPTRRTNRTLTLATTTASMSSRSVSSTSSVSASPTLSASKFHFGGDDSSNFEVCIQVPSKRKLAVLQQYERFPEADVATKSVQTVTEAGDTMADSNNNNDDEAEAAEKRRRTETSAADEPGRDRLDLIDPHRGDESGKLSPAAAGNPESPNTERLDLAMEDSEPSLESSNAPTV
ncbi:hypothetical protein H072_6999 [Dactylellina haptotyla CBS 200.50]|uniref:RFTS domain-containing protein n=1 Tax=Dactylellina haptotyla (strain CBS 200.50) TaxID=1284197 RepID=S8A888_DACHA|nr:hypothetical protein H072_6999 [Dactylellina haptotyla CBS 200.50]